MPNLGMTPDADLSRSKLLSLALRIGSFGYFVQDIPQHRIVWSPETFRIWGLDPAMGVPPRNWATSTIHEEDRAEILNLQTDFSWTEKIISFRILRPSGEIRYLRAHMEREFNPDGGVRLAYGILLDETERRSAELALEHSEARFSSLFETSGAGMVITTANAKILYVNTAFANLLGYKPHEILGTSIRDLSPPDTKDATFAMVKDMRAGPGRSRDVEKPYLHRDGSLVWVRLTINIAQSAEGSEEFIGVIQDLTERHHAEARLRDNEELLKAAQNIGKIGHWVWHLDSQTAEWSPEMCRIAGYALDETMNQGHRMNKHVHPEDMDAFRAFFREVMNKGVSHSLQFRLVRVDGVTRDVIARATPVHDSRRGKRLIGTIQDITEIKQREDALKRESVKAEAANRAKTLFLANMSHELRTPLNAILGFAQLLSLGTRGTLNADQSEYVSSIMRGGEHLLRLINDVLDLSRIDSGHMALSISNVDLAGAVAEVLDSFAQNAAERRIAMSSNAGEANAAVKADPVRLTQVLVNLVSNAIKFNHAGGTVNVSIAAVDDTQVRLSVTNSGHGISWDRQAEVFQHFNRLGAEAQGIEGTGIGLALSKRLVEEMNGTMGFSSEPHVRTTFWFDLPRAESAATGPRANIMRAAQ